MQLPTITTSDVSDWADTVKGVVGDTVETTVALVEPVATSVADSANDRLGRNRSVVSRTTRTVRSHPILVTIGVAAIVAALVTWRMRRDTSSPERDDWRTPDGDLNSAPRPIVAA